MHQMDAIVSWQRKYDMYGDQRTMGGGGDVYARTFHWSHEGFCHFSPKKIVIVTRMTYQNSSESAEV